MRIVSSVYLTFKHVESDIIAVPGWRHNVVRYMGDHQYHYRIDTTRTHKHRHTWLPLNSVKFIGCVLGQKKNRVWVILFSLAYRQIACRVRYFGLTILGR